MSLRIGEFEFGDGASLAPMAGVTNPPFRQLCAESGAIFSVTELISCHAVLFFSRRPRNRDRKRGQKTLALLDRYPGERPFVVQLYGKEPELMAEAAMVVEQQGADIIDLNFGCPARKVIRAGEGCGVALMRNPPLISDIARRVVNAVKVPVTAKTRLGYSSDQRNGVEVAKILEDSGVQAVTIHARTREQGHSGPVHLDDLARIVKAVRIPVIGNGGITCAADAQRMRDATGCAGVAVGQGAKGNPWIFSEIAGGPGAPDLAGRIATCRRHLALFVAWAGEPLAVIEMRKHACWYLKGFDGAAAFRKRLGEAVDLAAFTGLLDAIPLS
jgi:nifR3 family TIM-barrel protein